MQVRLRWKTKRKLKRYFIVGVASLFLSLAHVHCQWMNDQPVWEYEDDTPVIPIDVRLKLFTLNKAYHNAGDYHNDHFIAEYTRREHPNVAFTRRWAIFRVRWIGFNDFLLRYKRSIMVNAGSITAGAKVINLKHTQLAGTTRMVLEALVETAKDLTFYLEDDTVRTRWEIFIRRLNNLEDALEALID